MEDGKLDFLDEKDESEDATVEVEAQAEPEAIEEPEAPEGEKAEGEPPSPEFKTSRDIPITALLDEREKRQKAEREAEELRRWRAEMERQKEQPKAPDFYEDPEARMAYENQNIQTLLWNERLNMSEALSRDKHGDAAVDEARDAFMRAAQQNPSLQMELRAQANPYGFVVNWYKRQSVMSEIGNDPDGWKAKQVETIKAELAEQIRAEVMAELQGATPAQKPRPPASLSGQPAAGRGEPMSRGSAFDAAFGS